MKTIESSKAPAAIGPYSQAMVSGGFVFVSGQIPLDPATGEVVTADIILQTEQVMKNIGALLEAAGSGFERAVKATCYLTNMDDFDAFNTVRAQAQDRARERFQKFGENLDAGANGSA